VDLDGRLDAVAAKQWGRSVLLLNRSRTSDSYLSLDLRMPNPDGTTRPAIGAVVRVARADGRPLVDLVDGGNGHSGKRATLIHFGLGANSEPVAVTVDWRDSGGHHRAAALLRPGNHRIVLGRGAQ
jgi:hypothetical protein